MTTQQANNPNDPKPGDITLKGVLDAYAAATASPSTQDLFKQMDEITTKRMEEALKALWSSPVMWPAPAYLPWDHVPSTLSKPKETVIGYVEAWRWWKLATDSKGDIYLLSVARRDPYAWLIDKENVADETSDAYNTCGFYAYKIDGIEDQNQYVFGRVALYGDVIECEYGYRAEKARILDLWVDKDLAKESHSMYDKLLAMPQIKGVFDTSDPRVLDMNGNTGDYQCLTLENHSALQGTSLSDGRTINLLIDQRKISQPSWTSPSMTPSLSLPTTEHEWVVKPKGDICPICQRMIQPDEPVSITREYPDFALLVAQVKSEIAWKDVRSHLACVAEAERITNAYGYVMAADWGTGTSSNGFFHQAFQAAQV